MNIKQTIITAAVALTTVALIAPVSAGAVNVPAACSGVTFTRNLKVGASGSDVKCLQAILNGTGFTVSATGAGSPGNESMYFGGKTLAAVRHWQQSNGILPAFQVGPLTRAKLNAWLSGGVVITPPPPGQTGPVSAMLSNDNPASGSIVSGQASADLMHVTFTGSGTVNSVTLSRSGISDQNTLTNVYLYQGNQRLTDGYSFNSNSSLTMNNLNLPVNGSTTLSVRGDVATGVTNGTIQLMVTGFSANGTPQSATISGNLMYLVAAPGTMASATFNAVNGSSGSPSVNAGTTQYVVWTQSVQINNRAVQLKAANFKMVGSAPSDALSNIRLYVDGIDTGKVGVITSITGSNYAFFDFGASPLSLSTGSHTLDVRADIQKGAARTVQFSVAQSSDLTLFDPQVGVNIALGTTGAGAIPSSGATVNIAAGTPTVQNEPGWNAKTNVTGGASNQTIGKFIVHAYGEDLKVTSLTIAPVLTSASDGTNVTDASGVCTGTCGLKNVTVYFNGSQVGTQTDIAGTTQMNGVANTKNFSLGSQMIAPAGQDSILEIRADVMSTGSLSYTSGTIGVNLVKVTGGATGQNSQNLIDFPTATFNGHTATIQTASSNLAVASDPNFLAQTLSPNTANVKVGSFVIQNQSTSESVRVTNLAIRLTYGAGAGSTNISALKTDETSGSGATPIQPSTAAASGNATDNFSVNFMLSPGQSKTVGIYLNSGSSAGSTVTVRPDLNVSYVGVSSNISATSGLKTGAVVTFNTGTVTNPPAIVTSTTTQSQYIASAPAAVGSSRATFNFASTNGPSTINELKFIVTGSDATPSNSVTNICVGNVTTASQSTACSSPVSGTAYLTGLNLFVPNGASGLTQDFTVFYSGVGTVGLTPATTATTALAYVKYTSGGTTSTLCYAGAGTCTTVLTTPVANNTLTLVGSKPTLTVAAGGNTGMIINTSTKVGQVTVTADSRGDIRLRQFNFAVGYSNFQTAPTSITSAFLALGGQTASIPGWFCTAPSTANVVCGAHTADNVAYAYGNDLIIPAGTSQTFDLYVTTTGAVAPTSGYARIATSLVNGVSTSATGSSTSAFLWDDTSTGGSSGTGLTGALLIPFPTTAYSITQ
jgi:uncharacterized membrane protein